MKKFFSTILLLSAVLMLSSCIIVGSEDPEFVLTRAEKIEEESKEETEKGVFTP